MPSSDIEQVETIVRLAAAADAATVLDIGVGFGKYGFLLREYLDVWPGVGEYGRWSRRIEGIEAHSAYLTPVHNFIYDRVHAGNALDIVPTLSGPFDLILLVDVIEHFEASDGERLLAACERIGRTVLVATPRVYYEQEDVFHNEFERHRSRWKRKALAGPSGIAWRVGRSWVALRGQSAGDVVAAYRRRLMRDRLKARFPAATHAGIGMIRSLLNLVRR